MEVAVRDVTIEDAAAAAGLLDQLGYPTAAEVAAERLRKLVASEADELVVAVVDGSLVGLAGLHVSAGIEFDGLAGKLSALVVDERFRRRGIGEALVGEIERRARERGCVLLFLTTAARRRGAHAFYRRVGFRETGRRFAKPLA